MRILRAVHHGIFHASREGRVAEIVGWSNAAVALAAAVVTFLGTSSWALSAAAFVGLFALLRLALSHRVTVWIAAILGTVAVASAGGALAWVFAHVIESPAAPPAAAVLGALATGVLPGWAYAQLARLRADAVPDSLIEPVSARSSRP